MSSTNTLYLGPHTLSILHSSPALTLTTLTLQTATSGFPPFISHNHTSIFHIIRGSILFTKDQSRFIAGPGSTVSIAEGSIGGFRNADTRLVEYGGEEAEVLWIISPGEWVGCLRELALLGERGTGEGWEGVMGRWGCEVLEEEEEEEELMFRPGLRCMA
ncbi:hypothetical protein B0J14DRAFT_563271 [Halenospora varia]|nr:hypothetical protein B0J14DRAFT_563271 [Halenospora varia]